MGLKNKKPHLTWQNIDFPDFPETDHNPELNRFLFDRCAICPSSPTRVIKNIDNKEHINMTSAEELYAEFFNHEFKIVVKDMDDLTLLAHIEKLSHIALEAKARVHAAKHENTERVKKRAGGRVRTTTALDPDSSTTEAINNIKRSTDKLSKRDKLISQLMKLPGIDRAAAEKMVSAGKVLDQSLKTEDEKKIELEQNKEVTTRVNPFAAKVFEDTPSIPGAAAPAKDNDIVVNPINPFALKINPAND